MDRVASVFPISVAADMPSMKAQNLRSASVTGWSTLAAPGRHEALQPGRSRAPRPHPRPSGGGPRHRGIARVLALEAEVSSHKPPSRSATVPSDPEVMTETSRIPAGCVVGSVMRSQALNVLIFFRWSIRPQPYCLG